MSTKQRKSTKKPRKPRTPRTPKRLFLVANDTYEKTFFKGKHLSTIHRIYKAKTGTNKSLNAMLDEKDGSRRRVRTAMIKELVGDKKRTIEKKTEFPYGYSWKRRVNPWETPEMVEERENNRKKKIAELDAYFTQDD